MRQPKLSYGFINPQLLRYMPWAFDLGLVIAYFTFINQLAERYLSQDPSNYQIVVAGFVLFLLGITALRMLQKDRGVDNLMLMVAMFYAFSLTLLTLFSTGETDMYGNDNRMMVLVVAYFSPMALVLLVPLPAIKRDSFSAVIAKAVGTLGVNAMALVIMAGWQALVMLPQPDDARYATGFAHFILWLVLLLLFLLFFSPPRLYHMFKTNDVLGFLFYIVGIAIYLWGKVPPLG